MRGRKGIAWALAPERGLSTMDLRTGTLLGVQVQRALSRFFMCEDHGEVSPAGRGPWVTTVTLLVADAQLWMGCFLFVLPWFFLSCYTVYKDAQKTTNLVTGPYRGPCDSKPQWMTSPGAGFCGSCLPLPLEPTRPLSGISAVLTSL